MKLAFGLITLLVYSNLTFADPDPSELYNAVNADKKAMVKLRLEKDKSEVRAKIAENNKKISDTGFSVNDEGEAQKGEFRPVSAPVQSLPINTFGDVQRGKAIPETHEAKPSLRIEGVSGNRVTLRQGDVVRSVKKGEEFEGFTVSNVTVDTITLIKNGKKFDLSVH